MPVSVVDPVQPAIDATRRILFEPFDLAKWFVLGFSAWLATLGERGGSGGNWSGPGDIGSGWSDARNDAGGWFAEHLAIVLTVGALVTLLVVGLMLLVLWVSSRGKFMFLDCVLTDRAAVVEPWQRFRSLGNSLLRLRLVVGIGVLIVVLGSVGFTIALFAASGGADALRAGAVAWIVLFILFGLAFAVVFGLYRVTVNDVLVPIMYLRERPVLEAWPEVRTLIGENLGTFVRFVLLKILLAIGIGMISLIVVLCTCCIAAVPYLGTVILLPLYVFTRAYPLCFLGQFGGDYVRFARVGSPVEEVVRTFE